MKRRQKILENALQMKETIINELNLQLNQFR